LADQPHGGQALILKLRFLCAMAVAAMIFWYVGWRVAAPVDPQGPISLLLIDQGVLAMAELLGLAVVSSGLAVVICGERSAGRGPLAIAVGLASLAVRGAQLDQLILCRLTPQAAGTAPLDPFPTWGLMAECWLWLALIGVGFVVGRWVEGWFCGTAPKSVSSPARRRCDHSTGRTPVDHSPDVRQGLGSVAVTAVVGWTVISFTVGDDVAPILKGQIYFSLGLAFVTGALASHWLFRTGSQAWMLAAIAVVSSVAYIVFGPDEAAIDAARQAGTYVNLNPIARPLPIEFASMGAIGVLIEADAMATLRAMFGTGSGAASQGDGDEDDL
jgi:hypothetical protein